MGVMKYITTLLLGRDYRNQLNENVDQANSEFDAVNKRIDNLGNTSYPGSNEVTNARTDMHGNVFSSLSSRMDSDQSTAETAYNEVQNKADKSDTDGVLETLNSKAPATDVQALQKQVDSLASLSNGSTTGDAELTGIRTGADGVAYSTAGNAVRSQASNLKNALANRTGYATPYANILSSGTTQYSKIWNAQATLGDATSYVAMNEVGAEVGKCYVGNFNTDFSFLIDTAGKATSFTAAATALGLKKYTNAFNPGQVSLVYIKIPSGYNTMKLTFRTGLSTIDEPMLFEVEQGTTLMIKDYVPFGQYLKTDLGSAQADFNQLKNSPIYQVSELLKAGNATANTLWKRSPATLNDTSAFDDYYAFAAIKVVANRTYYYDGIVAYFSAVIYEDGGVQTFSDQQAQRASGSITPTKDGYALITVAAAAYTDAAFSFRAGKKKGTYMALTAQIPESNIQKNIITVKQDGSGNFTSLKAALDSIADSSITNPYEVDVYQGTYDIYTDLGGAAFIAAITDQSNNRLGLTIPNYVSLVGIGKPVLNCLIPDSVATVNSTACVSLLEIKGETSVKNFEINVQNCRYAIHDETGNSAVYATMKHTFEDLKVKHLGNAVGMWSSPAAYAAGTSSGNSYRFKNCQFISSSFWAWSMHNNAGQEPLSVEMDGIDFSGNYNGFGFKFGYYGANTRSSMIYLKNLASPYPGVIKQEDSTVTSNNNWNLHNYSGVSVTVQ